MNSNNQTIFNTMNTDNIPLDVMEIGWNAFKELPIEPDNDSAWKSFVNTLQKVYSLRNEEVKINEAKVDLYKRLFEENEKQLQQKEERIKALERLLGQVLHSWGIGNYYHRDDKLVKQCNELLNKK